METIKEKTSNLKKTSLKFILFFDSLKSRLYTNRRKTPKKAITPKTLDEIANPMKIEDKKSHEFFLE